MSDFTITDFSDREVKVGTTVRIWWDPTMEVQKGDGDFGVITEIDEWEGDVDDEGRSVLIPPRVTVTWEATGHTHSFATCEWEYECGWYDPETGDGDPPYGTGKVEELEVVDGPVKRPLVIEKITGTAHAPYVVRYVTDAKAVDFRYQMGEGWQAWEFDRSVVNPAGRFVAIHHTGMLHFDATTADRIAAEILTRS